MSSHRRWLLILPLFAVACAQVREITGGDKDTAAPVLLQSVPAHLSTRFTGNTILLRFDERIQLDRVRDRLLVSPPLDKAPDVRVTGAQNVTITLNAPLRANTTYTFGFGEAVKDLTEGNAAKGASYVVSTGDTLDSMQVVGRVVNAFSGLPEKDVLVMLYAAGDTSTIRKGRPTYATRSAEDGTYRLRYLRDGRYALFALRDQNANYRYDMPNEEVAFTDTVTATAIGNTTLSLHELRSFKGMSRVQQIREAKVMADGPFRLILARPAANLTVRDVARTGGRLEWLPQWNTTRDTVLLWPSDTTALASGRYEVSADEILDTLRYRSVDRRPFFVGLQATAVNAAEGVQANVVASRPLSQIDTARISLVQDSVKVPFRIVLDSAGRCTMRLQAELSTGASAYLTFLPGAVTDIYGGSNDTLRTGIGRASEQSTGTLRIKLVVDSPVQVPIILQLLSPQDRLVRETVLTGNMDTVVWERIPPGNHLLRAITDRNANGRWDTGDLDTGLQPEQVWRHAEPVNVRAAWDLGVDWRIP